MPFDFMGDMAKHGFTPMNHARPDYFEVAERKLVTEDGKPIGGYKALQRMDTGDTIAVHTEAYRVIPDALVFDGFERALRGSGLDIRDIAVQRDRSHDGARMFCQYVLPHMTRQINGAAVSLRFCFWNSHDGSRAAAGKAGFLNWVCANEAVAGEILHVLKIAHRGADKAIDITMSIGDLVKGAEQALAILERMERWTRIPVIDSTAIEVFGALPSSSERLVSDLNLSWSRAKAGTGPNSGATLWGLSNVLTAWATHGVVRANRANTKIERQERVAKAMQLAPFRELAA